MFITVERPYEGGTLIVTDMPVQNGNVEEILLGDAALLARYVRFLDELKMIGEVKVSYSELKLKFGDDFSPNPEHK